MYDWSKEDSTRQVSLLHSGMSTYLCFLCAGFSTPIAQWAATNVKAEPSQPSEWRWSFDLDGIADMYQ